MAKATIASLQAQLAQLLGQSPAAALAVDPATIAPVADAGWLKAAQSLPQSAPRRAAAPRAVKADPDAKVTSSAPYACLTFSGKPSTAQRDAMKAQGGFAHRDGESWFWFVPVPPTE